MENELLIKINGTAKSFIDEVDKVKKKTEDLQTTLEDTTKVSALSFAALAATIALTTKEYAKYETALVGVGKTTDIQGKKLDEFGKKFQDMAAKIPVSTNELLGIAQAAGQLGVKGEDNLLRFTDTVAKLGVATDLSGEEAATALTRILTVTGEGVEIIDKFGSVIVALGNNFAATESEIVRMATEVSRSTAVFGVNAAEAAALSASLKSVGVQAELGGSAIGRSYRAIDSALRTGGKALENLSELTGMTGEQLRATFAENSTEVFQKFIEGIGRVSAAGGDTTRTLAAFGLKGEEILKVLPVLAQNSELVGRALNMANAEMENATALEEESARAFDTLAADAQRLANNVTTLAVNFGKELAPEVRELLGGLSEITKAISTQDSMLLGLLATLLKWAAALVASVTALGSAGLAYLTFQRVLTGVTVAFNASRLAVIGFTSAVTFGLTALIAFMPEIVSGIGALFSAFNEKPETQGIDEISNKLQELKDKRDAINNSPNAAFDKNEAQLFALDQEIEKYKKLLEAKTRATEDFGTGSLILNPTADVANFDPTLGLQTQAIPFAPEEAAGSAQSTEELEAAKLNAVTKGSAKRVQALTEENEKLKQLEALRKEEATAEEIEFANRRVEIEQQRNAALLLTDDNLKAATLENNRLKNEELLFQEQEYYNKKVEQDAINAEKKAEFDLMLRELSNEQLDQFNKEDLDKLQLQVSTKEEVEKQGLEARLKMAMENRRKYLDDEQKFGTTIAAMNQFFRSEEVTAVRDTTSQLVQLQNSKNSQMKAIGKAAAMVNSGIATAEGAIKAYSAMAGIPIVGPALGAAAAAAIVAYGAEQQATILGANEGGVVPFQFGARRGVDSVPAMLTPNELVVPEQSFDEVIEATADARIAEQSGGSANGNTFVIQGDFYGEESYIDFLADKLLDAQLNRNVRLVK